MEDSTSREKILKKVRKALINKSKDLYTNIDFESPLFKASEETSEITFAQNFTEAGGKFIFCMDKDELIENLQYLAAENKWTLAWCADKELTEQVKSSGLALSGDAASLLKASVSITTCEFLVARTGSVMMSSRLSSGRTGAIYPPVHIVIGYTSQLVSDIKDALKAIKIKYPQGLPSMISFITGPSRTADIEKTVVMGAHGPKDVYVFLIDDLDLQ